MRPLSRHSFASTSYLKLSKVVLDLMDPYSPSGAVDGVYLMRCLAANVDTLLSVSIIVPPPAFPPLHSQSVGVDTLVLNTSDHGAGYGTSVFLRP
jgi:hypothetical protein